MWFNACRHGNVSDAYAETRASNDQGYQARAIEVAQAVHMSSDTSVMSAYILRESEDARMQTPNQADERGADRAWWGEGDEAGKI